MAEGEKYKDEIQIIAEKLTSTTTIQSAFSPVQRKGRTFKTSSRTNNAVMTYDGPSGDADVDSNADTDADADLKANADARARADADTDAEANIDTDTDADTDVDAETNTTAIFNLNSNVSTNVGYNYTDTTATNPNTNVGTGFNTTMDKSTSRNLPELNVPEKILLIIDTVREESDTQFKLCTGTTYPSLLMIKRAVEMFIAAKSTIQRRHEFALMTMNSEDCQWVCDFTSSVKTVVSKLNTVAEDVCGNTQTTYDLGSLFEKIQAKLPLPEKHDTAVLTFTTRIILVYTRSNCMPMFHVDRKHLKTLMDNPYFFLDILYIHETPSNENMCEEIYKKIASLEMTNFSYIMEVGKNAAKLHEGMAKLLAHPLQRPPQIETLYTLCSSTIPQQVHTDV